MTIYIVYYCCTIYGPRVLLVNFLLTYLQVKMNVFLAYMRSVGVFTSCVILLLYTLNNVATVYSNFWLSYWSNDAAEANGTVDTSKRDMRLGVYGALGLVQGGSNSSLVCFIKLYRDTSYGNLMPNICIYYRTLLLCVYQTVSRH